MTTTARKPWLANLMWATALLVVVSPVLYVLSYAPAVRLHLVRMDTTFFTVGVIGEPGPYSPVDWLIDHTPLQRPLFWWAGLFGVREDFEGAAEYRDVVDMLDLQGAKVSLDESSD
jgi:hypothetical protein